MARTFTGLKLEGSLGKFGKTEISDIDGYVELPDGKVIAGLENHIYSFNICYMYIDVMCVQCSVQCTLQYTVYMFIQIISKDLILLNYKTS